MIEADEARSAAAATIAERMRPHVVPDARFDLDLAWFIPGFSTADVAADRLAGLDCFSSSRTIFVTPDNGLSPLRELALRAGKTLVLPTYGLRRGFVKIDGRAIDPELTRYASWLDGLTTFGQSISLDELALHHRFDLVVTAASAISAAGQRFGMGSQYLDLEYPILAALGTVDDATPIAAIVHEEQRWADELPVRDSDVLATLIVTPSSVSKIATRPRPSTINWALVDPLLQREPYFAGCPKVPAAGRTQTAR